jgi:hypothetical protein
VPILSNSEFIVHGADGPYLMEKSKWPNLKLVTESQEDVPVESLTQEESILKNKGGSAKINMSKVGSMRGVE